MALSGTGSIAASSQVNLAAAAGTFSIAGTTAGATITTLNGVANSNVTLGTQTLTISNGSTTYAGIIGGTGGLSLTAGTETLSGTNTYTGATTINGGTLALSGTGSIAASSQVNVAAAAGTFSIAGTTAGATITTLNGVANSNVTLGTQTLTISNGSTTYAGIIGGTGGLSLTAGTETLSGTNTYTGATTINGGTLALSGTGSIAASSQVNLAAAAGTFSIVGTTAGATIKTLNGVANSNVTLGTQTLTISNGSTTYAGVISGTGGLTVTAGIRDSQRHQHLHRRHHDQWRHAGAERHRQHCGIQPGERSGCRRHVQHCGHHGGRYHHDAQRRCQQQRDAGRPDADDLERLDHLCRHHRRHRRAEPDGRHRDAERRQHLHRRHHHQWRHAGAERHRQHCGIQPGERSGCRRRIQHCGYHGGRHHHDAQRRCQQQRDAGG